MKSYIINSVAIVIIALLISSCGEDTTTNPIFSDVVSIPSENNQNSGAEKSYIVVLNDKNGASLQGINSDLISNDVCLSNSISLSKINNKFNTLIAGFSATLNNAQLEKLRNDSRVKFIEEDKINNIVLENNVNLDSASAKRYYLTMSFGSFS